MHDMLLTVKQASERTGILPRTLHWNITHGYLRATKPPGIDINVTFISENDLDEFLRNRPKRGRKAKEKKS